MSTIETSPESLAASPSHSARAERAGRADRTEPTAVAAWVTSADSKVIGRSFVGVALVALVAVTVLGVLLGLERIDGDGTLLDDGAIVQLFVGQRITLIYGLLGPLLLGVAVAVVPLQVGARALAFPRLAAAGFWVWLAGVALVVVSLAGNGGPLGGDEDMVDLFIAAHALVVIGLAAAALSVATTVLTTRAPGMRLHRVPFFSWSALVMSLGVLLVAPVMVGTMIYLFVDHRHARLLFGGNAGVASWLGAVWTQPTTYLFALPAFGLLAELVPIVVRKRMPMRPVVYAGLALIGVAALAGVSQRVHTLAWAGSGLSFEDFGQKLQDLVVSAVFWVLPLIGALVVVGVTVLAAEPAAGAGRPAVTGPFVLVVLGAELVLFGMVAGLLTAVVDLGLQGTVYEEGVLMLVGYGGALAGLGGVAHWLPKWTGRRLGDARLLGLGGLGLLGTLLASVPYLIAGFADQPAQAATYDYAGPSALWNVLATVGHVLMALVALGFVALLLRRRDQLASDADPWQGHTLEWLAPSPAPADNFLEPPTVMSPEPAFDLRAAQGGGEDR